MPEQPAPPHKFLYEFPCPHCKRLVQLDTKQGFCLCDRFFVDADEEVRKARKLRLGPLHSWIKLLTSL